MTCRESVHACVHVESLFRIKLVGRVGTECCGADRVKRMFILMSRCTVAQPLPPPSPFNDLKIIVPCVLQPVWLHGRHTSYNLHHTSHITKYWPPHITYHLWLLFTLSCGRLMSSILRFIFTFTYNIPARHDK